MVIELINGYTRFTSWLFCVNCTAIVSEINKGQNEKNIRCTYLILQGKEILKSHYGKMNYLFNLCDTHYTYNILSSYF